MGAAFVNSVVVAVPATVIPILFAAFAAYAFTFMDFRGKDVLFIAIVAVMVVPIQVAFQPLLDLLGPRGAGISGQYIAVWLLHTGFGMPLAIYTLRNYMSTLPVSIVESAKIDGCNHYQIFWRLVAPMVTAAGQQALVVVDKTAQGLQQTVLEAVHFVPLKSGIA